MKAKVYVETSIISYLTAHLSRDLVTAARQQITHEWWNNQRADYDLYVSELVIEEARLGNAAEAQKRLKIITDLPVLNAGAETAELAQKLIVQKAIPQKAEADALHVAFAALNGIEYLLTWNFKHIANARMRLKIYDVCRAAGYEPSQICTPEELSGD